MGIAYSIQTGAVLRKERALTAQAGATGETPYSLAIEDGGTLNAVSCELGLIKTNPPKPAFTSFFKLLLLPRPLRILLEQLLLQWPGWFEQSLPLEGAWVK